ncbi:MAG: stage III sporulation protein AF [Oscillospiraceae bacterium]
MTELLGAWVRAIGGAALISTLAMALTPNGKVKNVLRIICGIVLIIAIISPLISTKIPAMSMDFGKYRKEAEELIQNAENSNSTMSRAIIEQDCEAYISDKAQSMDIKLYTINVQAKWSDGGYWYPFEAELKADISQQEKNRIANMIEAELGISSERQYWSAYEEQG